MTLQFPKNPQAGDKYNKYIWNGSEWIILEQDGGGGGGVEEAPIDGQQYARQDASWTLLDIPESGIEEAPNDGGYYVRHEEQWVPQDLLPFKAYRLNADGGDFDISFSTGAFLSLDSGDFDAGTADGINYSVEGGDFD